MGDVLTEILYKALNRYPPLIKKEIVEALRAPSVQQSRLANQIEANYIPLSQRGPQHVGPDSLPVTQTGLSHQIPLQSAYQLPPSAPPHATLENIPQTLTPSQHNTSQSFASHRLTTELPRTNQPQSNLDQVGQSHQLPTSISMLPPPTPQTNQSVSLQPQPGTSLTSLQWTPQMPAVPQLTPSAPPQTHILPPSNNTQPSSWLGNSQLAASQQLTTEVPRLNQPQPNLDQVGQSHQLPASQRMSMTPQPGPQMQHWSQLQCPPHHPNYQHLPLQSHPGYPFPHPPNPPIHRPHESQSFPPYAPSHNQYSSLQPFHSHYSSVAQPPHDQYSQPFGTQSFTQLSHDQNIFQPSHYTPYQHDQGHQSHQFQWQSSSQPPSQHHHSPVSPSQHFHTSDTNLPQTQESQSSPAPTFAATSESTPFLEPSPSPRQQPSSSPRQQPSLLRRQQPSSSPRQQMSYSPSQQQICISYSGSTYTDPPPAKRLRQLCASSPASELTESTAVYPQLVNDFISFVKQVYSAQKVLRDENWSLSPTVKFINLASIDRKCVKSKDYNDVTKAMVMDGNVDAIEETKGPIKFSEIAKGISLPSSSSEQVDDRRLILVEGAPGVGKSTFAWEFCRRWMNDEIAQQYHLVLLLRLRDKRIREAKYLKDLFFHPSTEVSAAVFQELLTSHTFHALIILEGYDELPDSCRNDPSSVFNELISGKLLPLATVLVTSRPWATKDLHRHNACHIYQHIEVLGFTKKQIKEYLQECIQDQKVRSDFNSYLEKHPQINSGMYIPLNSAIVVAVYKESIENDRQTLPNTITELYSCCIEILIRRHLNRDTGLQGGNEMNLPAINLCFPSDVHRNFVHMCRTYTDPPPAKRLRQQNPSPPYHSSPAGEAKASTAGYPPLVNDFINFVKQVYSAQKVLRDEKWSLSPTVKFINLACIDRKCIKSREYNDVTKAMVMDGNVDAIEETKGPIKFSEIAKGISLPSSSSEQENDRRLILVEGAPGVGKSTFAWEFCRKWMNGEIAQQYHLVLLLRLRDKRIIEAKNLKDLLFNPSRSDESLEVYKELKNSQKFHALIILEGYDELPDSCRNDPSSVFNELISGKLLPLTTVLVTSRPWATKDLHEQNVCHIYQHIEVLGFTKQQIKKYIDKNISEEKIRSGLNSYLEKHPQIRSGMYIPLNSAIVVAVYKESIENDRQNLPNTITELYNLCIEILIRRHLKRNTGLQGGNEMNLPAVNFRVLSDVHRNFVHMCHLAFSGIVEATEVKLIFSESEVPDHFDNLGFMDSVTDLYVTGETVSSHNFLHLTFQEFFAAVHISTMSKEEQLQYFMEGKSESGSKKGRLNVVLKFLAGLRKLDCFTNETASHIVNPTSSVSSYLPPSDITVGMDVVNWLFEAQSETVMSLILGKRKVEFNACKRHMSPMDYYSLGYCISHSQCQWVLLLTGLMEISKEKMIMLADGARDVAGGGKVVEFGDDALSHFYKDKLYLLFTECNNILCLQKLSIEREPTVWPDFSSELRVLELCAITDKNIEFLITLIKKSNSLRKFTMSMAWNASESAHKLLELVQTIDHHPTLQEKSVKGLGCRVTTDVDVKALSQLCSKYCDSMRTEFISYVGGLSDDGVVVLAEILQHKYGSRELNLSYGGTSDDGTVSLAKALRHNSTIHELRLVDNKIGDKGAVALADALHHNSTL